MRARLMRSDRCFSLIVDEKEKEKNNRGLEMSVVKELIEEVERIAK